MDSHLNCLSEVIPMHPLTQNLIKSFNELSKFMRFWFLSHICIEGLDKSEQCISYICDHLPLAYRAMYHQGIVIYIPT